MLYLLNVLYLATLASALKQYTGLGSENNQCAPAPQRTSKTWKPTLDVENSGLNLATGGEPQLTLMVVMDSMYLNQTNVGDEFDWFSPRFSYPDFCGTEVPRNIAFNDYSHAPGDTSLICETSFEVNMEYVKYCNFDVTDDETEYKFSGHMLSEVKFRQTFLGDYVFQSFSRPIGFVVSLPKILTVTTDITVINPDQCATSADCNGQVCEEADTSDPTTPKICKCDECHSGTFCEVDNCAPQLICPADVTIEGCSQSNGQILDAAGNPISLPDLLAKASDTVAASGGAVVGTAAGSLTWARTISSVTSTIAGTYSTITEGSIEWQQLSDGIDAQDGVWIYPAETVVEYCVSDAVPLTSCCQFKVKVEDTCSARITCDTNVVQTNDLNVINNAVFQGTADDAGLSLYTVSRTTGQSSSLPDGFVDIQFCVQDHLNGIDLNAPACCTERYEYDQTAPVITCQDLVLTTADYSNVSPSTELPLPTFSDAGVGIKTNSLVTIPLSTEYPTRTNAWKNTRVGSVLGVVVDVFTFTVEDVVGNSNTCTSTVKVTDPLDPKITCTPAVLDDSNPTYDADDLFTTADNDAIKTETSFAAKTYTWGSTTESTSVEDYYTNSATQDCTVIRKDTTDPTISCPASDATFNMDVNSNAATVTSYVQAILNSASDNQEVDTITVTVDGVAVSGPAYVLIPTVDDQSFTFVVTVTDKAVLDYPQNSVQCTFNIIVNDNQNPSITCPYPSNLEVNTDAGQSCGTPGAFAGFTSATDNAWYDGTTASYDLSPSTCYEHGSTYTVTGTAFDKALNPANSDSCTFVIAVVDNENPVLTCTDITVGLDYGLTYSTSATYVTPTMWDNVALAVPSTLSYSMPQGSQFPLGPTVVTATVTDSSGNTGSCTFTVTVVHDCGDGVVDTNNEECDGTTGCTTGCICDTATHKPVTGGGCQLDCANGYNDDGTCTVVEECELEINTAYYSNTVPPVVVQCDYTDYANDCNINSNDWALPTVETTALTELKVIDMIVEWYPYGEHPATTGSQQEITGGEYAEVKICCLDRPQHPLEVLVFNDVNDETSYVDSVADCQAKGYSSAAVRPVWQGVGTPPENSLDQEGCFYVPVCSGGVVVIGEKYNAPTLQCNAGQADITVDLTTLVAGSTDCAAVTAPTDFTGRYTVVADTDGYVVPSSQITAALANLNGDCAATTGFDWTVGTHPVQFSVTYPAGTNSNGQPYLGATTYCTFNVVVTDKYDPTYVSCPATLTLPYTASTSSATFTPDALSFRDETDPTIDTSAPTPVVTDAATGAVLSPNTDGSYTITAGAVVTWTVYDTALNDAVCTQSVVLDDSEGPVMTCANAVYTATTGTNTALAPLPAISCIDAVSGDCSSGAIASVTDYEMTAPYSGTVTTYSISSLLPARYVDSSSYFDTNPSTKYMYSYTATGTDADGNTNSCTGYVTIESIQSPQISCPDNSIISLTGTQTSYQVVAQDSQFTVSDNDGAPVTLTKPTSQTLSCHGTSSNQFTASVVERLHWAAKARLTDQCTYTVSVRDDSDPSISCPTSASVVHVECPTTGCTSDAEWDKTTGEAPASFFDTMIANAVTSDNCDDSVDVQHNGLTSYAIGSSTVTLTATDDTGNTKTASCPFDVLDKIPPRFTVCPDDQVLAYSTMSSYSYSTSGHLSAMSWSDNVAVDSVSMVSLKDSNGNTVALTNGEFTPVPEEVYTFVYTATDTNGNDALTDCSFTIEVRDDVAPTLQCPDNDTFEATGSAIAYTYTALPVTTSDNYNANTDLWFKYKVGATYTTEASVPANGQISLSAMNLPSAYATLPSSHTIELKVRDEFDNWATCSWTVTIEDTTRPTIDCSTVGDIEVRPTTDSSLVNVDYGTLGFAVSDIHAEQNLLDSTVTLSPASGSTQYAYSASGQNTFPVTLSVTDDQTTPNLSTSDVCFNVVILPPYPPAVVEAALKSVRITTDSAGDFYADIVFLTGINWPHTLYTRTGVVADDTSISYSGETRADEVTLFETRHTETLQTYCASQYQASATGFAVGSACFQDWGVKLKFGSCDAVDMEITVNFKSVCDNEGPNVNDCDLSANHVIVLKFAAEDYCTKQLSDVDVEGSMTTYTSNGGTWTNFLASTPSYDNDGTIVVLADHVPTADTTFDPAAQVVAMVTVTSTQALIKKVTILVLTRTECTDVELTQCGAATTIISRTDKDAAPSYNVPSTTDAQLENNFAYGQYTEAVPAAGATNYIKLDATVAIEYLLQAGGNRRRTVLELEIMEANYPKNIAHLMPRARRSMAQDAPLETTSQVAGNFALDFGVPKGGKGGAKTASTGGSGSDLPPYVVPAVITVLIVALCFACAVGCCCYYIGVKKRKDDKEFINDNFEGDQEAGIQTNIYLSPNMSNGRSSSGV